MTTELAQLPLASQLEAVVRDLDLNAFVHHDALVRASASTKVGLLRRDTMGFTHHSEAVAAWHRARGNRGMADDGGRVTWRGIDDVLVDHSELVEEVAPASGILTLLRTYGLRAGRAVTWALFPGEALHPHEAIWSPDRPDHWYLRRYADVDHVLGLSAARDLLVPAPAGLEDVFLLTATLATRYRLNQLRARHPEIGDAELQTVIDALATSLRSVAASE